MLTPTSAASNDCTKIPACIGREFAALRDEPPGQTPSGMALAGDGATYFVCESGCNDVAVIDVRSGEVNARIPTGCCPVASAPILDAFAATPDVGPYVPLAKTIEMVKNPGKAVSFTVDIDGPESVRIPDRECAGGIERARVEVWTRILAPAPAADPKIGFE